MPNALQHSPARVLQELLISIGAASRWGDNQAWPVFATKEPDAPDNVLTTYNTSPVVHGSSQVDGETWQSYGFQVRIRANDPDEAWAVAAEVQRALDQDVYRHAVTVEGSSYCVHSCNGTSVMDLNDNTPRDKRSLYTVNGTMDVRAL